MRHTRTSDAPAPSGITSDVADRGRAALVDVNRYPGASKRSQPRNLDRRRKPLDGWSIDDVVAGGGVE